MTRRVLAARLDSMGDVLLMGPAVRALAAAADSVTFLAGPRGRAAAELLPGVDDVIEYHAPWVDLEPPELTAGAIELLVKQVRDLDLTHAVIFTSFHQSPLPLALVLRMAGVRHIGAISVDYPGSLLDVRHNIDDDIPETERALSLTTACGYRLPDGDDGELRLRGPLPDVSHLVGDDAYIVFHPGAAVPARRMTADRSQQAVRALHDAGFRVVVTAGGGEKELGDHVAGDVAEQVSGTADLATLAAVLERATVVVAPNTGPAHLAAAVGTPVVSLFAPVVPPERWAPYRVATVILGDQEAACAHTRARDCPISGHPCLESISDSDIISAVVHLSDGRVDNRTAEEGTS